MFYVNKERGIVVNGTIIEWDIRSGNTSVMYEFDMMDKKRIDKLAAMNKQDRVVAIGKIMKKDKEFSKNLEKNFNTAVNAFITANNIPKENIISIKRDAVYVLNWQVTNNKIGNHIEFVPKNTYDGWLYISPFEFYHIGDSVDVKGLNDNLLPLHRDGMLSFIDEVFKTCASSNMDPKAINTFMSEFVNHYKKKELIDDYYREFNVESQYRLQYPEGDLLTESLGDGDLEFLDISHNYLTLVLPVLRELC